MKWFTTIAFLLTGIMGMASEGDSITLTPDELAIQAYENQEFNVAYNTWSSIEDSLGYGTADLYYNMGNAAWKSNQTGRAIWRWNQALKLNPDMEDAQHNLALAEKKKVDKIVAEEKSPINDFFKRIWQSLSPNTWAIYGIVFLILMMVFLALLKYSKLNWGRFFLPAALVALVLGISSIGLGWKHQNQLDESRTAVILTPNLHIKSAPMEGAADAFILHEGTEMNVRKTIGNWHEIQLADGKVGWVPVDQVGVY